MKHIADAGLPGLGDGGPKDSSVHESAAFGWTIGEAKKALRRGSLEQREALAGIANFLVLYGVVGPRSLETVRSMIEAYERKFGKGKLLAH